MAQSEIFDVIILGSGQGGKHLAWHLGRSGKRVAVVERRWVGGSCSAVACMPTKNEIWSARIAHLARHAAPFGTLVQGARTDMEQVRRRKRDMVEQDTAFHIAMYRDSNVELIMGTGRFTAPRVMDVALNDGGSRTLTADDVVLNVGSHAALPDVPGLREAGPLDHIEALELAAVPAHLVVIGGGVTGIEFAQMFRRFGSRVTMIEPGPRILVREDDDVAAEIHRILSGEGVEILTGTHPTRVDGSSGSAVTVAVDRGGEPRTIEASHLLAAVGRIPNTAGIGLEDAGVALTDTGFVEVDDRLRATAPGVWGLGECAGSPQFTHVSVDDFRVVRDTMKGVDRRTTGRLVPSVVVTDPPLARIGLSEGDAQRHGMAVRVAKQPNTSVLRAITTGETGGFMKALVNAETDHIVGFTMIGADADNVMATVQAAMLAGAPFQTLRDAIFAHPTMAEGLGPLLEQIHAPDA